jgi:hypothetical protein
MHQLSCAEASWTLSNAWANRSKVVCPLLAWCHGCPALRAALTNRCARISQHVWKAQCGHTLRFPRALQAGYMAVCYSRPDLSLLADSVSQAVQPIGATHAACQCQQHQRCHCHRAHVMHLGVHCIMPSQRRRLQSYPEFCRAWIDARNSRLDSAIATLQQRHDKVRPVSHRRLVGTAT